MKLHKMENKHKFILKYSLLCFLIVCTIFSETIIQQRNSNIQVTISSIFIFLIIGLSRNNISLLIITLLNFMIFAIKGFNILTCIQALEIYYVWFLYKRNKKNIVIQVLIFWTLLALPLIFITSYIVNPNLKMESLFFIVMIFLNRIFNALISNMLLDYIPFEKIIGVNYGRTKTMTLSNLFAHAGIASIVVPMIIFFFATNSSNQRQTTEMAVRDLKNSSEYVNQKVNLWTEEEKNNLKLRNPIQIYDLIDMLNIYVTTSKNSVDFYLVDLNDRVITSDNTVNYMNKGMEWLKKGSLTEIDSNIYKWTAARENTFIIKNYSTEDAYLYVTTVNSLKVVIAISGSAYASNAIGIYLDLLKILLPLSLFFVAFVIILKRLTLNSISKLINITSGLPEKINKNEAVIFEKSNIYEIDSLTGNFQTMVDNLSNMISNVESSNKKLQESEQMLFDQAHFDSLTGLPNRYYFIKYVGDVMDNFYINEIYANKQGIAFFFIDLDKFKTINDTFGHSVGDTLLKEAANRMNNVLKTYSELGIFIARLGGDEFVIEFIYDNKDEIIEVANTIIDVINKPISINNNEITSGASIGICLFPEDAKDIENIFIKSDTSMYKAKYSGGNKFIFYS